MKTKKCLLGKLKDFCEMEQAPVSWGRKSRKHVHGWCGQQANVRNRLVKSNVPVIMRKNIRVNIDRSIFPCYDIDGEK